MLTRFASVQDLELVAELRLAFLAEHRQVQPSGFPDGFGAATLDYLRRQHDAGTAQSWLAERDGHVVGVVTMLLLDLAPRPEDESGLEGYIVNMYVRPTHRRRGVGKALLEECLAAAHRLSLRRLLLYATDDGLPLYARAGFASNPMWMERSIPPLASVGEER